jgi:hypothetical protein
MRARRQKREQPVASQPERDPQVSEAGRPLPRGGAGPYVSPRAWVSKKSRGGQTYMGDLWTRQF